MKLLTIGDVCGEIGLIALSQALPKLIQTHKPDLIVVNGENADVIGLTPLQAERIFMMGAHVVTLGNHAFGRGQIASVLDKDERILRPLNLTKHAPGGGYIELPCRSVTVGVMCLIGRCYMEHNFDNPFLAAEAQLAQSNADIVVVEFHAEATSEKMAMAYHLDGLDSRVVALYGTHTHVQTSDERVFPNGMGAITDIGMTGAYDSILGVKPHQSLNRYLGKMPERYTSPQSGATVVEGAVFSVDTESKKCIGIERVRVFGEAI
ncbi:MAG: YmdB family metallophosphoesterase [Oscillospiraceae bacterium]|nr:YmdB family metallophosphoesterase [Oscillospiraceae bacterium]